MLEAICECIICHEPVVVKIMHMYDRGYPPALSIVCKKCSGIAIGNISRRAPKVRKYKDDPEEVV